MVALTKDFSLTFVMHPLSVQAGFTLGSKILGHCFSLDHKLKGRYSTLQKLKKYLVTSLVFALVFAFSQGGKKKMC